MTPRKAKRTERKSKVNWRERCEQWQKEFTKIVIERAELLSDRADLCCELSDLKLTIAKRDIACADLNAELREKDATISGLREIEGKLNARVGELEHDYKMACDDFQWMLLDRNKLFQERLHMSLFMEDCQLVLATGADMLCGTRFMQAAGLQQAFKRYADRTALPKPEGAR